MNNLHLVPTEAALHPPSATAGRWHLENYQTGQILYSWPTKHQAANQLSAWQMVYKILKEAAP